MQMSKPERARINAQGFTFIARGMFAWGEGETEAKAVARCKTQLRPSDRQFAIETFRCSTNAFVNNEGTVVCDPTHKPVPERDFIERVSEIAAK